jgi:hypothetical protein
VKTETLFRINTAVKYAGVAVAFVGFVLAAIALVQGRSVDSAFITFLLGNVVVLNAQVTELKYGRIR